MTPSKHLNPIYRLDAVSRPDALSRSGLRLAGQGPVEFGGFGGDPLGG